MSESRFFTILVKYLSDMKVEQIFDKSIDSYGGLHFFHRFIEKSEFGVLVEQVLGKRPAQAKYSYSDVLICFVSSCLAGCSYTEDLNILRRRNIAGTGFQYCSSDTFLYVIRQLVDLDHMELRYTENDKEVELFFNEALNRLILHSFRSFFDVNEYQILDHDHTKLYNNKPDARPCYKGKGYYASCFSTDQIPLYISLQSGNATPKTNLIEVLTTGFEAMKQQGLSFDTFRADGACYSEEAIRTIRSYCDYYIVRSRKSLTRQLSIKPEDCALVEIGEEAYRICEQEDTFAGHYCRRIFYQKVNEEKHLFSDQEFDEIITCHSKEQYSTVDLIHMYFDRGGVGEQINDELKNDYNVNHLPFKEAPYNLCYVILAALSMLLVRAFKSLAHTLTGQYIKPKMRIKQIMFRLIAFPAKLVCRSRQKFYKIYCQQKELIPLVQWANS